MLDRSLLSWIRQPAPPPKFFCFLYTNVQNAGTIIASTTIPADYDLHVQWASAISYTAGVTTTSSLSLKVQSPGSAEEVAYEVKNGTAGVSVTSIKMDTECIIQAGSLFKATGIFSAAAVGNVCQLSVHGILMPRLEILTG